MEEAEQMADCVGIIDHGQIVVEGAPQELISQFGSDTIRIVGGADYTNLAERLRALPFVESVHTSGSIIQIGVDSGNRRLAEVVTVATQTGLTIEDISIAKPSLGDVFLKYTGRQLRDR
jgi:ABC-2 type transport system ATP-binding protein